MAQNSLVVADGRQSVFLPVTCCEHTMKVCGQDIRIGGKLIRIAGLSADTYEFVDDPEAALDDLRHSDQRIDLFTFMQKLPETSRKYSYLMEWDNLAVLPVSTFDQWWTKQINDKTRNMARRAGKKGVLIREVPLDDAFVEGVWAIYNECPIRQGKRFPHYGKDLLTVRKMMATFLDRSVHGCVPRQSHDRFCQTTL
jgi:hypothetical protein